MKIKIGRRTIQILFLSIGTYLTVNWSPYDVETSSEIAVCDRLSEHIDLSLLIQAVSCIGYIDLVRKYRYRK